MKRLALWAIGLILIATNAFSQNNTYNMVITMANGTTISIGPNEVKDITFNDGEIQVTGQTLEQVVGQIGTNRIRIDSLSVVTNNLRDYIEVNHENSIMEIAKVYDQVRAQMNDALANLNMQLQKRIEAAEGMLMMQLEKQINDLKAQIKALEEKVAQHGGITSTPGVAVDLGLPSGTKWADRNVGASSPEEYGGYYAWGETDINTKAFYDYSNYIHCDGYQDSEHDIGSDIAGTQYDVAHVNWGASWKMPTLDQVKELLDNCTSERTTVNGINGRKLTGPNGNSIFLPAAGIHWFDEHAFAGMDCYYWSSTLIGNSPYLAHTLYCSSSGEVKCARRYRFQGLTVRPVYNN